MLLYPYSFNNSILCVWTWGKLGLRGHAKKGIVFVTLQRAHKFDTGLPKSACSGADLWASLTTQVLQVPLPASHPPAGDTSEWKSGDMGIPCWHMDDGMRHGTSGVSSKQ